MPAFLSLTKVRNTLFANPINTGAAAWLISTVGYLIPTFIKLIPLGKQDQNEEGDENSAQDVYTNATNNLQSAKDNVQEAEKRVNDLDCAEQGYLTYDENIQAFQTSITESNLSAIDQLNVFWKIQFAEDQTTMDQSVQHLSWTQPGTKLGVGFDCPGPFMCGQSKSCCVYYGNHPTCVTKYYDQTTTVNNDLKNMAQGPGFSFNPLNCGDDYSRSFSISSPTNLKTGETISCSGTKENGQTYININRQWGSEIKGSCSVDGQVLNLDILVLREDTQAVAASDIVTKLIGFLARCVMAAEAVSTNYSALRDSYNQSIPGLIDKVAEANATVQAAGVILARVQAKAGTAESEYDQGLNFWLPQLFLVPIGIGLLVCLTLCCCRSNSPEAQNTSTVPPGNDVEAGFGKTSSTYSPKYFNDAPRNNLSVQDQPEGVPLVNMPANRPY